LEEFEDLYTKFQKDGFPNILEEWRNMSETIGQWVKDNCTGTNDIREAIGVDNEGRLLLKQPRSS